MISYIAARLREASTWAGFGSVVAAAAVVPAPYSYLAIACGLVAVVLPGGRSDAGPAN